MIYFRRDTSRSSPNSIKNSRREKEEKKSPRSFERRQEENDLCNRHNDVV